MSAFVRIRQHGPSENVRGELTADPRYAALGAEAGQLATLVGNGELLKRDPTHSVLVVVVTPDTPRLLCKFFPEQSFGDRLRQCWGLDRPARIHRRLKQVAAMDLPIPPSLGHISVKGVGAAWFCPMLPGTGLLHWAGDSLPDTAEQRTALLFPVLDTMGKLHAAGFVHGDFKWGNVLLDGDTCWLVDVDGLRTVRHDGFCRGKARDLARFLLDCEEAGVPAVEVEALLCRYAELTAHSIAAVKARVGPIHARLKERHRRRYGEGYRLTLHGPNDSSS